MAAPKDGEKLHAVAVERIHGGGQRVSKGFKDANKAKAYAKEQAKSKNVKRVIVKSATWDAKREKFIPGKDRIIQGAGKENYSTTIAAKNRNK